MKAYLQQCFIITMESEIRRLLEKAEMIVEKCVSCGSLDCDECEDARNILDEIRSKIEALQDKKAARKLSVFLDKLEEELESME